MQKECEKVNSLGSGGNYNGIGKFRTTDGDKKQGQRMHSSCEGMTDPFVVAPADAGVHRSNPGRDALFRR
jgi:hypothetical protein